MHIFNMSATYSQIIERINLKLQEKFFTNCALLTIMAEKWLSLKCCKFIKNIFINKLLHAHLQYICNIHAKHSKDTLKTVCGVDFTYKCTIIHCPVCAVVKNWLN